MKLAYVPADLAKNRTLLSLLLKEDVDRVLFSRADVLTDWDAFFDIQVPPARASVQNAVYSLGECLVWNGETILPHPGTVCFLDTRTGTCNRLYLGLFPEVESDLILDCSESVNRQIERMAGIQESKMKS